MRIRLGTTLTALALAAVAAVRPAATQANNLVGSWRGTSTCVDREHFPACKDEQVIYDAVPRNGSRDTVTVRADKIVNGIRDFMGESDYTRAADGSWVSDIETPRFHVRIVLRVEGTHMSGTITDVGSGYRAREMSLERIPASPPAKDSAPRQ